MKTRYSNPWFKGVDSDGKPNSIGPEFYESDSEPVKWYDCLIYERQEFGYTIFDVVLDGMCVTQRASINGAKQAIENREWEQRDWWQRMKGIVA